ncbi:type II toxin-antitoxin system RelE/ParE family toxin [Pseudomonas sp. RC10]|uniref:type II toxin-antitoxin system RelE/ParE family toxin n=1 Tax=Pseudomonas bambusae TaxID=3139142 RepID=UPI00313A0526
MYTVLQTDEFASWHSNLCSTRAKVAIARRIDRAAAGNLGDLKSIGGSISEMRLDIESGYRIYLTFRNGTLIILLAGGNKASQSRDIRRAQTLVKRLEHE